MRKGVPIFISRSVKVNVLADIFAERMRATDADFEFFLWRVCQSIHPKLVEETRIRVLASVAHLRRLVLKLEHCWRCCGLSTSCID